MSIEAVRFRTHIQKGNTINIPARYKLEDQDAEVIVLLTPARKRDVACLWEHWIEKRVLGDGELDEWSRAEIYDAR